MANIAIDLKDFQRDFRSKIRDPLVKKLESTLKDTSLNSLYKQMVAELIEALNELLPYFLYQFITGQDARKGVTGSDKYLTVLDQLRRKLQEHNLSWAAPIILPMIETAVRMIYRKAVESVFDKAGLEDAFEKWLGFSVDSGDTPIKDTTPPAKAAGK